MNDTQRHRPLLPLPAPVPTVLRFCGICALILSLNTCDLFKVGLGDKVDINPPSVSVRSHKSGDYVGGTLVLSGAATDDSGVKGVSISVQVGSASPVVSTASVSNGTWTGAIDTTAFAPDNSATPTASPGEQADILVTCTDNSGKTATASVTLYFDNTPPVLWLQTPTVAELAPTAGTSERILAKTVRFEGGAKDFAGSQVSMSLVVKPAGGVDQPPIPVTGSIAWSVDVDTTSFAGPTDATFTFIAADPAGNKTAVPAAVRIDQNADAPLFVIPSLGVDQRPGATPSPGTQSFAPGESLTITVEDSEGVDKNSVAVNLVPTPPHGGTLTYVRTNRTSAAGLPISVDFAYKFSDVTADLPLGAYRFEVTASDDLAGKPNPAVGVATRALTVANTQAPSIVVDKGPPDLTVSSPVNGSSGKALAVAGTASDGYDIQSVSVRLNNGPWQVATLGTPVTGVYPWTYTPPALPPLADGSYSVDVQALDKGGTLSLIKTVAVTLDNQAPAVGFATVSPLVGTDTVNGVISFTATASDVNGLSGVRWWVLPSTQPAPAWADAGSTSFASPPYIASVDTTTLAGGGYTIWVSARDQAGNEGSASYPVTVSQASDLPAITLTNMNAAATTPGQATLNLQETNAKLTGSMTDDDSLDSSTIEISMDSAASFVPVTTKGPTGRSVGFEHNLGSLAEGPHYFHLRASDLASAKAGKPAVSAGIGPVYFLIDRNPPDLTVTSPGSGSAHNAPFSIAGTSSDANGVAKVEVSTNAGSTWTTLASAQGPWTLPVTADPGHADDGLHSLLLRAADSVGKTTTVAYSYTIDTRAPTFSITTPSAAWLSGATVTASGTAVDTGGVGVSLVQWSTASNAGPWSDANGTDSWTALLDLAALGEGQHTLYVRAADLAGNQSPVAEIEAGKRGFGVDQSDPTAAETGIGTAVGFRSTSFGVSGTAADTNALSRILVTEKKDSNPATIVLDQPASGTSQGWSIPTLPSGGVVDGTYVYAITVTDAAGRTSAPLTRTITIDRTPPTATIGAPGSSEWLAGAAYTMRGTSSDGAGVGVEEVRYYIGASAPADPSTWSLASGTNNWSATLDLDTDGAGPDAGLAEGPYTLHVSAKDAAGNWMGSAVTVSFGVDQASPSLSGLTIPAGTNYRTVAFSLDGTAADTNSLASLSVTQSKDGAAPVSLPAPAVSGTSQAWSVAGLPRAPGNPALTSVTDGIYEYVVTVTDVAGKQMQVTRTVTVDTTAPAVGFSSVSPIVGTDTVNGVIGFSVSASDANGLAAVKWWMLPATDPVPVWTTAGDTAFASAPYAAAKDTTGLNGGYRLWAGARDQAGNEGWASFALTVDQASDLPAITLTNMVMADSSHASDNLQENNAKLTGTITDDDSVDPTTIQISIDGGAFGPVSTPGSGRAVGFEYSLTALDEGTHHFSLRASDLASAKSGIGTVTTTIGPVYFVVDKNAPAVTVTAPAQNAVKRSDFNIQGTASDFNGLKDRNSDGTPEVEVSEDGGTTWVLLDATSGDWTYVVTGLFGGGQEGTHTFRIRATDIFSKQTVLTFAFMVDTVGPAVMVTDPAGDNQLVTGTATSMSGTASDGTGSGVALVEYSLDGTTWAAANGTSSWTANINLTALTEGSNTLHVRATDPAGNTTAAIVDRVFLLDRTPPTSSETGLGQSVVYRNTQFDVVVNAADTLALGSLTITESKNGAAAVPVVNATPLAGKNASYTFTRPVNAGTHADDGTYVYEITVLDSAGRSAPAIMRTVTVDTVAPVVSLNAPAPSIMDGVLKVNGTVTVSGSVDETSLDTVDYQVGASAFTPIATNKAAPHFTVDTTGLTDNATTVVTVRATDKAGNAGTQTVDLNVYQESDRPRIVTTNLTLGGPNPLGRNPAVLFTVEDDDSVDASMIQYSVDSGSTWSDLSFPSTTDGTFLQAKTTLTGQGEGPGHIRVRAMDVNAGANWSIYGNSANKGWSETADIPFFVDYGPPTTTLTTPAATTVFNHDIVVSGTTQDSMGVPTANLAIEVGGVTYTSTSSPAVAIAQGGATGDPVSFTLTVPISALADGDYNIQVRATDGSGTTGTLDRPIGIDKTAPTNTFISPESGATINGTIAVQGQVSDNRAIQQVYLWEGPAADTPPADVTQAPWQGVGNNLLWSTSLNTAASASGARKIMVVTEDAAGNRSTPYTLPFTVDQNTDKPVIELTTLKASGAYGENLLPTTLQIAGTVSDDDGVDKTKIEVAVDLNRDGDLNDPGEGWTTVSAPPAANGRVVTWSHTFTGLTDNQYELHVRAADINDSSSWGTYSSSAVGPVHFSVDTANPTGSVIAPAQGLYTSSTTVDIQGHAADASGVQSVQLKIGSNTYAATTSNAYADWAYSYSPGPDGQVSFQVIITDVYGKVSTIDRYYIQDTLAPSAAIDTPAVNPDTASGAYNGSVTFRGTAADTVKVETLYYEFSDTLPTMTGFPTGWTLAASTYNWTASLDTRGVNDTGSDVTHYLAVVSVDSAGNRSGLQTLTFSINQASDKPGLTLSAPTAAQVFGTSAKALGAATDDDALASVEIRIDANNDGDFGDGGVEDYTPVSVPAVVSGKNVNFEQSVASLADGPYKLQVRVRDAAYAAAPAPEKGFHENESAVLSFSIDILPPGLALTKIEVQDRYGGASHVYTDNFGGRYLNNDSVFTIAASDASGISAVEFSRDGSIWTAATPAGGGSYTYNLTVDILTNTFDGTRNVQYRATDGNGKVTTNIVTVIVDTVEPAVVFTSPSGVPDNIGADAPNVNGDVIVQGTVADSSSVTGVTIAAGSSDQIALTNTGNALSWKVTVTGSSAYANATYAADQGSNVWRLRVKVTATELAGNRTIATGYLDIDPNSDNPVVNVVSPAPGDSVAGVFLINGTVVDDDGAQSVRLQVDLNNDGFYGTNGPFNGTLDLNGDGDTTDDFENETVSKTVTVTNGAWSILMNGSGELNKANLAARGLASPSGTIGFKITPVDIYTTAGVPQTQTVYIDSESPIIKGLLPDDTTETAQPTPATGTLQKGSITVRALFKDDKQLDYSSMQVSFDGGANYQRIDTVPSYHIDDDDLVSGYYQYRIRIPVDTTTAVSGGNGTLQVILKLTDKTYKQTTTTVQYNVDNTLPLVTWDDPATLPPPISGRYNFHGTAVTTDNELFGKASDSGVVSGIQKINVYFVKASDIINPRTSLRVGYTPQSVRQSGGSDQMIPFTEDSNLVITIDKRTELGQFDSNPTLGDQDGFNESLKAKSGYDEWYSYFDSTKLPDGPIDVYFVAYDEAGNKVYGTTTAQVTNNPPSIGTLTFNGTAAPADLRVKYGGTVTFVMNTADAGTNPDIDSATYKLTVANKYANASGAPGAKDGSFTSFYYGANAGGAWKRDFAPKTGGASGSATLSIDTLTDGFVTDNWYECVTEVKDTDQNVTVKTFYLLVNNADNNRPVVKTSALVDDNFDDFTQTSLVAGHIEDPGTVTFNAAVTAAGTTTTFTAGALANNPFIGAGWTVTDTNLSQTRTIQSFTAGTGQIVVTSAFGSAPANGHALVIGSSALLSGTVRLTGKAYDDTDVNTITVRVSTDGGATFSDLGAAAKSNQTGSIVTGYTYDWSYSWDTSTVTGVARSNVVLGVYASDGVGYGTLATKHVDVVPYITSITDPAGLSADVLRGATGRYSAGLSASNLLTVNGWNLSASGLVKISSKATDWTSGTPLSFAPSGGTSTQITVSKNLSKSGYLTLVVNGVSSPNNVNDNTLDRNKEVTFDPRTAQWRDDRYLWVWTNTQLNGAAFANQTFYYPDMAMSSTTQPIFGYTDDNGGDTHFSTSNTATTIRSGNRFQRQAAIAYVSGFAQPFILTGQDTTQNGDNMGFLELTGFANGNAPDAGNTVTGSWIKLQGSDYPAHVDNGAGNTSILRKTNRFPYPKIYAESIVAGTTAAVYTTFYDASLYYQSLNFASFRTTGAQAGNYTGLPGNDNGRLAQVTPIPGTVGGHSSQWFDMVKVGATGIAVAYYDPISTSLKLAYSAAAFAAGTNLSAATGQEKAVFTFTSDAIANYAGKYFTVYSGTTAPTAYDIWFDTTGAASKPAAATSANSIRVDISGITTGVANATRTRISAAVVSALRTDPAFADSGMGATGTVTQPSVVVVTNNGNVTDARTGNLTAATAVIAVTAGAAATTTVSGMTYTIATLGTTNFTLIGAASNTVGLAFTATGAGAGTGTVNTVPTIGAAAMVAGTSYTIATLGTTNFTLYGAASNTLGLVFTATGAGAGTGTVYTTPTTVQGAAATWATLTVDASGNVGQHVSMASDGAKLYLAYYDYDDASLKFARLTWNGTGAPSLDGVVNVDKYLSTGTWTRIGLITNANLTGQGNNQPFISYHSDSYIQTKKPIRVAFPTFDAAGAALQAGTTNSGADETYSGYWEVITVPAQTPPKSNLEQFLHVNIASYVSGTESLPVLGWLGDYLEYAKLQPNN